MFFVSIFVKKLSDHLLIKWFNNGLIFILERIIKETGLITQNLIGHGLDGAKKMNGRVADLSINNMYIATYITMLIG